MRARRRLGDGTSLFPRCAFAAAALSVLLLLLACAADGGSVNKFLYQCLCHNPVHERVDDLCCCDVPFVERLNEDTIWPLLHSIVHTKYFSYYRLDLRRECPFWQDDGMCIMDGCHVNACKPSEVPQCWKEEDALTSGSSSSSSSGFGGAGERATVPAAQCDSGSEQALSAVDGSVSASAGLGSDTASTAPVEMWTIEDAALHDPKAVYYNLHRNPERYTGYKGYAARRIWAAIYEENCFDGSAGDGGGAPRDLSTWFTDSTCNEKRVFYRLLSGLHASITCHLIGEYLPEGSTTWGPNYALWAKRMESKGEYLENLFFSYLVVLRAVEKAAPDLRAFNFTTGNETDDAAVRALMAQLATSVGRLDDSCPRTFDETALFHGPDAAQLRAQFSAKFYNISRIMDCVGCTKCRLWGKIQLSGLGTALKILFAGAYKPERTEITALMWLLHQLSVSLRIVESMRELEVRSKMTRAIGRGSMFAVPVVVAMALALWLWKRGRRGNKIASKQL